MDPEINEPILRTVYEEFARITTAAQKQIVAWAVQIAAGIPVEAFATAVRNDEEIMYAMLKKTLLKLYGWNGRIW